VGHAIGGLGAGGYIGADLLQNKTSGWSFIGFYLAFAALFIVFAIIRRRYRTMFVSAYVGMTLAVAYILLFVTR
jgi:asparagine N-glycosylation enzyme membrane subunit Stt3